MKFQSIEKQIEHYGMDKLSQIIKRFTVGEIAPYPYQAVAYIEMAKRIRDYEHPVYIKASVSAGKTIMIAMAAKQCQDLGIPVAVMARQAEIVKQDSEELTNFSVKNSVYCAGLNVKSAYFPVVVGSEGTVVNGLDKALGDFYPMVLLLDECHQLNWEDVQEAIENKETMEQMRRAKDKPYRVNEHIAPEDYKPHEFDVVEWGTGRAQYTIIIIEFMNRCRQKYNRELRIIGLTGSEFRGVTPILVEDKSKPGFWREQITNIDTNYLVEFGSVVPTTFGATDLGYDFSDITVDGVDGVQDFSDAQMKLMNKRVHESLSTTQAIMKEVQALCSNRNAVLVTCAGQRHCKEAVEALEPGTTYAIITEKTNAKKRQEILDAVNRGEIKYTFQVMALTTGVNVPLWDTSVLLRKIGSLTLLIQLLGRGMRLLKKWHKEAGYKKDDHLVLDYAGAMDELGKMYFDPILEQQQYQLRKSKGGETIECEVCKTENSKYARRCMGRDSNGNRCEFFFKFRLCEDQLDPQTKKVRVKGCGTKNDIAARVCRGCDCTLLDPNDKLSSKHYSKSDWFDVMDFNVGLTKNQRGFVVKYKLNKDGDIFTASEVFFPESQHQVCRAKWKDFCKEHIKDEKMSRLIGSYKSAIKCMQSAHMMRSPTKVTHRRNAKGQDIIYKKEFPL